MPDGRTKEGQEQIILDYVEKNGGFSIFWVTDNQRRAHAATRLVENGTLIRQKDAYPWCAYKIRR